MPQLTYQSFTQGHDIILKKDAFQSQEILDLNLDEQCLFRFLLFFATEAGVVGNAREIEKMSLYTPPGTLKALEGHNMITLLPSGTCIIHSYCKYVDTGNNKEPEDLLLIERM